MALKTGRVYKATNGVHYTGRYATGLALPANDEAIYFGDEALGVDSLYPLDNIEPSALAYMSGIKHAISPKLMLSTRPTAICDQDTIYTEQGWTTGVQADDFFSVYTKLNPIAHKCNLVKESRTTNGTLFSFEDNGGQKHTIVVDYGDSPTARTSNLLTNAIYVSLITGDGLATNAVASRAYTEVVYAANATNAAICDIKPLFVDTTAKKIYFQAEGRTYNTNATYVSYQHNISIVYITYTTVNDGGSLTLGATLGQIWPTQGATATSFGNSSYGITKQLFYFGKSEVDGQHIFGVLSKSSYADAGTLRNNTSSSKWYTNPPTNYTYEHAWYISKVDPTLNTVTTITTLAPAPVNDHRRYEIVFPTHFETSPIAGEDTVKYAFCFGYSHPSYARNISIYNIKWDTSTDTFTTTTCTTDVNPIDNYNDAIEAQNIFSSDYEMLQQFMAQANNLVLTNDGNGGLFLTLFYEFNGPRGLIYAGNNSTKWCSYSIDTSNMSTLTFHSATSVTDVYKAVSSDLNNKEMLAVRNGAASVLSWTNSGWSISATKTGTIIGITKDHNQNYWVLGFTGDPATTANTTSWYLTLDVANPSLPNTVSVRFEDSSISFSGVDLTRNILVSAYDLDGDRIAVDCTLKITGNSAVFASNAARTLTVTTSDAADLSVPLTISGPGFVNVSASFDL